MVFALSRQINKQKYAKTVNLLCPSNIVFVKYQAQGFFLTPPPLRTPLVVYVQKSDFHLINAFCVVIVVKKITAVSPDSLHLFCTA